MKRLLYIGTGILVLGALVFAYYAISPLFRNIRVDEQAPLTHEAVPATPAPVVGTSGHPASGTVRMVRGDTASYIRYENFKTINGPDLYVYLATDLEAKEFINLGLLKATEGNVNYEIPTGVDLQKYRYVLVWCKQFGVLFNYADIVN